MKRILQSLLFIIPAVSLSCGPKSEPPSANNSQPAPQQSAAAKPAGIDPCSLVTEEEAVQLFDKADVVNFSDPPAQSDAGTESKCTYTTPSGYLQVTTFTPTTAAQFERLAAQAKAEQKVKFQPLTGIGEQAFIIGKEGSAILYLLKGNTGVRLNLHDKKKLPAGSSSEKSLQAFSELLKTLATNAASRMR